MYHAWYWTVGHDQSLHGCEDECVIQGSAQPLGQEGPADYAYERKELPGERAARVKAELAAAAAAAVDELDPEELRSIAPPPPPDRQLMVYDDI